MSTDPASKRDDFPTSRGKAFGQLQQVFDDVWWVWGTTRFFPGATFPRNMIVLKEADGLVLVHPVLLPEPEQQALEALGPIRHIVRLGDFHGMDDAAYQARYGPTVWAPAGATPREGVTVDHALVPGGPLPVADGTLFSFDTAKAPELVLHLARHGGAIVSCDAVQNWEKRPEGCSLIGMLMAKAMGFKGRACIGPGWRKATEPPETFGGPFRQLLTLDFQHLLASHGPPVLGTAKADLQEAVARLYPG